MKYITFALAKGRLAKKAKNDLLFSDVAQRFKAACAVAVILQEDSYAWFPDRKRR